MMGFWRWVTSVLTVVILVGCQGEEILVEDDISTAVDEPTEALEATTAPAPWPPPLAAPWPADQMAPWPTEVWSTSSPEAQGIDSQALIDLVEFADGTGGAFHSILIVRNGYLVLEAYWHPITAEDLNVQFSATKSIVSALTGIAYMDGLISGPDQLVADLFADLDRSGFAEGAAGMTVGQVLMMAAGIDTGVVTTEQIMAAELKSAPGTAFQYGNAGPQLLANAIQELTGMDVLDFAQERLFTPLGISPENVSWATLLVDYRDGGSGLQMRPRDMAKIGYLYLNQGMWDGETILPADWVEWSVFPNEIADFDDLGIPADGYGFFWWVNRQDGYYLAVGLGGQMIVVFPGKNMVVVTTGDSRVSRGPTHYNTLNTFVVPLALTAEPMPENPEAAAELEALLREVGGLD